MWISDIEMRHAVIRSHTAFKIDYTINILRQIEITETPFDFSR